MCNLKGYLLNALFSVKGNPFITSNQKPPKFYVGDSQFSPSVARPWRRMRPTPHNAVGAPGHCWRSVKPSCLRMKNARQASEVAHFSPVVPRSHLRHVDVRLKEAKFKLFLMIFLSHRSEFCWQKMCCLQCCGSRSSGPFLPLDPGWGKNADPGWTSRIIFPRA